MKTEKRVIVVGAGGVGFWLTVALCRDYRPADIGLQVYDPDITEGSGGRRLPYAPNSSTAKVDLITSFLGFSMGDMPPRTFKGALPLWQFDTLVKSEPTLIVDCTDMGQKERAELIRRCQDFPNVAYLRVSYDGNGWVTIAKGAPFEQPGAAGGYDRVPTLAQSLAAGGMGAAAVASWLEDRELAEYQVNVNNGECLSTWEEKK